MLSRVFFRSVTAGRLSATDLLLRRARPNGTLRSYSSSAPQEDPTTIANNLLRTVLYPNDFFDVPSDAEIQECECNFGMQRPEFKSSIPLEPVKASHHIFITTGIRSTLWQPMEEQENRGAKLVATLLKQHASHLGKVPIGLLEYPSSSVLELLKKNKELVDTDSSSLGMAVSEETARLLAAADETIDMIIFPEGVHYKDVALSRLEDLVKSHFVLGQVDARFRNEKISSKICAFVCCHNARDRRCGFNGPRVYKSLVEKITANGLKDIAVFRTSHFGGHKYAGNVILFHMDANGAEQSSYVADWYGYVNDTTDVDRLLDAAQHGRIVRDLWRRRTFLPEGTTLEQVLEKYGN